MSDPSVPQISTIRATGTWAGKLRTDLRVGGFQFATGEPVALGGDNSAPSPMQLVVGAFNGCLVVVLEIVAREQGITLDSIHVETTATMDRRGFAGTAPVSPHFQTVDTTVDVSGPLTPDTLAELAQRVESRCPAYNLLNDAGARVSVTWNLGEEARQ